MHHKCPGLEWDPLTKVPQLRSFLGLVNYYRRFINGYSSKAAPLTDLLKKGKAWTWDEKCQQAFEDLKKAVTEEPVLALPDHTKVFEVHTDASDFAIGGVLMQEGVPNVQELKMKLMYESHNTIFTMHLGGDKMYRDLKQYYWWRGMKKDIVEYLSKCLTCQQVKAEQQVPFGLLNPIPIQKWKWDNITMNFVSGCPLTQKKHDSVWVIMCISLIPCVYLTYLAIMLFSLKRRDSFYIFAKPFLENGLPPLIFVLF